MEGWIKLDREFPTFRNWVTQIWAHDMLPGMATPSLPRNLRLPSGKKKRGPAQQVSKEDLFQFLKSGHTLNLVIPEVAGAWTPRVDLASFWVPGWQLVTLGSHGSMHRSSKADPEPHCAFAHCTRANSRSYSCAPDMRTKSWCYIYDPWNRNQHDMASGTESCKEECFFSLCSFRPCLESKQLYTSIPTQTVERLLKQFLWGAHSRVYSKKLDPSFQKPGGWLKASFEAETQQSLAASKFQKSQSLTRGKNKSTGSIADTLKIS